MSKILITGGCGYIGSHTIVDLIENGFEVVSIDNLSNSSESTMIGIEKITGKKVINHNINLCDFELLNHFFESNQDIKGIIHFAALKSVGDSVSNPIGYFENNLFSLLNLLKCMNLHQINNFIFSSSCSVYGNADELPVTESTPFKEAESPYARTKQMGEQILQDFVRSHQQVKSIALRYFNPAGAHYSIEIGESSRNIANNLVPVITETAIGKRSSMTVFGKDYHTRDGSCIRDYIHVSDIAHAHTLAIDHLLNQQNAPNFDVFNLGIGEGVTVLEAIKAFEYESNIKLNYHLGGRRDGDVVAIYANNHKAKKILNWEPKYSINDIMNTAWLWEKKRSIKD